KTLHVDQDWVLLDILPKNGMKEWQLKRYINKIQLYFLLEKVARANKKVYHNLCIGATVFRIAQVSFWQRKSILLAQIKGYGPINDMLIDSVMEPYLAHQMHLKLVMGSDYDESKAWLCALQVVNCH
ncbi:hypothetical protein ACJX0J_012619, partial [Zea mays]